MIDIKEKIFKNTIQVLMVLTLSILVFLFYFLIREAMPLFDYCKISDFLFGTEWMPVSFGNELKFGIWYFILGTVYVSFIAIIFGLVFSIGIALFITFSLNERLQKYIFAILDLISAIPSVVFGFFGLQVFSPIFFKIGVKTGNCVLLAGIVLTIMILPFMINSLCMTFFKLKKKYLIAASNLGIDKWYIIASIIIPESIKSIVLSTILANCRAMGETMAVMMVVGNAKVFPHLLGKGETIASLIALEMGTAIKNSPHYHALYAAGVVLLILTFVINQVVRIIGRDSE